VLARASGPARRLIRLDDVRSFLESPLQGGARVALGLRTVDDDTEARQTADEPLGVPRLIDRRILGELFLRAWKGVEAPTLAELAAAYDEALLTQRLAWLLPAGPFAAAARAHHLELLASWREAIVGASVVVRGPARDLVFGRPDPALKDADVRPALPLTITPQDRPVEIELQGRLRARLAVGDAEGSLILGSSSNGDEDRDGLRPFIEHLLLAATGAPLAPSRHLIIRPRGGSSEGASATELVFAPVAPERARAYLTVVLEDLFARPHDYLLPCEAVFRAWKDREKDAAARTLRDRIVETRDDPYYRGSSVTKWGPVPQPFEYPPPSIDEGERLAEQRFGLYFALRQFVRKAKEKK
jgi:exodeoxyribonuclease V gamma subunit